MYQSRPPVALIPAATTKSTATVSNPSFANPSNPSSTVTTPAAMSTATAPIMTWSGWMMSHRRHPKATMTTQTVNHPSQTSAFSAMATDTDAPGGTYFTLLYGTLEVVKLAAAVPRVPSEYPSPRCVSTSAIDAHRLCV